MIKKRFNIGKALSFAFMFAFRFPKYVLVPWVVMIVVSFTQLYLSHTVVVLKYIPRAEMASKSIHYSIGDILIKNLFTWTYLLVTFFLAFIILSGYIHMIKNWLERNEEPTWKDFFSWNFPLFFKFILVTFMLSIFSMVGLLLLIVPGIIIILTYTYAPYVLIDHHGGVVNAFSRSGTLTKGVKGRMFLLGLFYTIFLIPNFYLSYRFFIQNRSELLPYYIIVSLLVGLIGQVFQLAMTHLYLDLSTQAEQV